MIKQLLMVIFSSAFLFLPHAFNARISVLPDTIVEVGDEVFFSANETEGLSEPFLAYYEWDFGDGYALKRGSPYPYSAYTGTNCIHYFMQPGIFDVKLIITERDSTKDSAQVRITVTGEAPVAGFELWRAPYHGRIAQYIYAQIPPNISDNSENSLRVRLIRDKQDTSMVFSKTGLEPEEKFLLKNGKLPSGDYELLAELLNNDKRISYIKEKFTKPYKGIPKIGINEFNAICINGEPFFPVTPYLGDKPKVPEWANKYINSTYGAGYYTTHNLSTWSDYINLSSQNGLHVIGPERWEGKGPLHYEKNSDIRKMAEYVHSSKNDNAMMMYMWDDEPNGSGRHGRIPPSVNAAWTYMCHSIDPQHLVTTNLYGYRYLPHYGQVADDYDYLDNSIYFGGKKHQIFDVIGFDVYPINAADHISLLGNRIISDYAEAIDFMQSQYYGLVPAMSFIEVQPLKNSPVTPTPEQILMLAWLNVVHGIKGINWFHYFGITPQESLDAMGLFYNQITKYSKVVLGAPSSVQVTDDANEPGKRVDFMVREKDNSGPDPTIYIFAVRVTEPDSGSAEYVQQEKEPDNIVVNFAIPDIMNDTIISDLDNRKLHIRNGTFQDTFKKCQVRIYRIGEGTSTLSLGQAKPKSNKRKTISFSPFATEFEIDIDNNGSQSVLIYSLQGKLIEEIPISNGRIVPKNRYRSGIYIARQKNREVGRIITLVK